MRDPLVLALTVLVLQLLLCISSLPSAAAKRVTISNVLPRLDNTGGFINAHDGGLYEFDGIFHLYGTVYEHCHQPDPTCNGVCGYYNNTFSLYTSPDLVNWTLVSLNILPAMTVDHATVPYWMANVAYNPLTQLYMMQYQQSAHKYHCITWLLLKAAPKHRLTPYTRSALATVGTGIISMALRIAELPWPLPTPPTALLYP